MQKIAASTSGKQASSNDITIMDAVESSRRFFRRQGHVIISSVLLLLTLGALHAFLTASRYTARVKIEADLSRQAINPPQQQPANPEPSDPTEVDSQIEAFRSANVLLPVVEQLKLREDGEFSRSGGLGSLVFGWSKVQDEQTQLSTLLELLDKALEVRRVGKTHVIEVLFTARSPSRAAELANAIADSFIQDRLQVKFDAAQKAVAWLENRLAELRRQSSAADEALEHFKSAQVVTDAGGRHATEQQLNEIKLRLTAARSVVVDTEAKLNRVDSILRNNLSAAIKSTALDDFKSDTLANLQVRYLALADQEAKLNESADNATVVSVRGQMEQLNASITDELKRMAEAYKENLEIANDKVRLIEREAVETEAREQREKEAQIKLRELENTAKGFLTTYDNYASFLHRDVEQLRQQSMPTSSARIISPAMPPLKPSHPKTSLEAGVAALIGFILGFAIALFRDIADQSFRTREQVKKTLGVPCITMVPKLGINLFSPKSRDCCGKTDMKIMQTDVVSVINTTRILLDSSFSPFSEAIQAIRLSVDQVHACSQSQIIGVTSVLPKEGKSTMAACLAQTLAQAGMRVVLVDCDLRVATLTKVFADQSSAGLQEIAINQVSIESAVKHHEAGFMFLPAGVGEHPRHPTEILTAAQARGLFEELRRKADYLVLDLPPLGPFADARSVNQLVDLYLLVIEWGETRIQTVEQALNMTEVVKDRLLGVALNKVDFERLADYEGTSVECESYKAATRYISSV